jgi:hypothetical protein
MVDADENQQGRVDLPGLCEFSWSSLKHVEVMAWGSFTFCKSPVFSKRQLFCYLELCYTDQSLSLIKPRGFNQTNTTWIFRGTFSTFGKAIEVGVFGICRTTTSKLKRLINKIDHWGSYLDCREHSLMSI